MKRIGTIVGILVFVMILGTSMAVAAEGVDASASDEVENPVDWDDSVICMANTAMPGKTEMKSTGDDGESGLDKKDSSSGSWGDAELDVV